jgi:hypothetical protein
MHVASLMVQDDIRKAAGSRLAKEAKQAARTAPTTAAATRGRWVALRRLLPQPARRAH